MKKLIALLLVAAPLLAFGQTANISSLYKEYMDKKGVTTVMMTPDMLSSALRITEPLTCTLMVISAERSLSFYGSDFKTLRDKVAKITSQKDYKLLMDVKDDDETVRVYAKETAVKGELKDVIVLVSEADEITVVGVDGVLPASLLSKLSKIAD